MDKVDKRQRSCNMSVAEKTLLADLCLKYQRIIENKQTDGATKSMKAAAWSALCEEFNAQSTAGVFRDAAKLKHVCSTFYLS